MQRIEGVESRGTTKTVNVAVETHLVRASLLRFSRSWPVWAPLSLLFISPSDWRVGKTASRACGWCQWVCCMG